MAGGSGTRFWPKSRQDKSKQFLTIHGRRSLIKSTVDRIAGFASGEHLYIVSQQSQREELEKHISGIPKKNFIYEPEGKNTAPCLGLTALHIQKRNAEGVMIVLPADHLIKDKRAFKKTITAGVKIARKYDSLVTIGIKPNRPATGYGYIQRDREVEEVSGTKCFTVKTFAEKPDFETAKRFLQSGDFSWNSGMFIFKVSTFLEAIEEHLPELYAALMSIRKAIGKPEYQTVLQNVYKQIKKISIDYGVMEKARNVYMVEGNFDWNDLGSWEEVYSLAKKDANGNFLSGDVITIDTTNSYIDIDEGVLGIIGLDNIVVVRSKGSVLICARDRVEEVKKVVEKLHAKHLRTYL